MVLGPEDKNGNLQYWNNENIPYDDGEAGPEYTKYLGGWNSEHSESTRYDKSILCTTLPVGTDAIMEFSTDDEPVSLYTVFDLPLLPRGLTL